MKSFCETYIIPIYGKNMTIILSDDETFIQKSLKKNKFEKIENLPDICGHTKIDKGRFMIWLSPKKASLGTISHECFHAASFIIDYVGDSLCVGHNDEQYALLIGYLVDQILHQADVNEIEFKLAKFKKP